ncbi:unnamed protein product, partial [Gulo gulo]
RGGRRLRAHESGSPPRHRHTGTASPRRHAGQRELPTALQSWTASPDTTPSTPRPLLHLSVASNMTISSYSHHSNIILLLASSHLPTLIWHRFHKGIKSPTPCNVNDNFLSINFFKSGRELGSWCLFGSPKMSPKGIHGVPHGLLLFLSFFLFF